jgi:7,8-dihydropterin-6-yl-methyl-4-(beta-D-ribofuranosyl)aminobenzene 5'-phosphate synthase
MLLGSVCLSAGRCMPPRQAPAQTAQMATAEKMPSPTVAVPAPPGRSVPTLSARAAPRSESVVPTRTQPVPVAVPSLPVQTEPGPVVVASETVPGITITILYDNNTHDERLETVWGFSCLVEGLEDTILFDTGSDSALLLRNMHTLEIDPRNIDVVVISHIHGDHIGGLTGFLEENHLVTVYLPRSFPESTQDAIWREAAKVVQVHEPLEICEHAHSTGELGDGIKEQSLVIETGQGLVAITGCAHPGIVNIVRQAKELRSGEVCLVLGGFHLGSASEATIADIVEDFQQLGVRETVMRRKALGGQDVKEGLLTSGIYRHFRHPIYTGIIWISLGLPLTIHNLDGLLMFSGVLLANVAQATAEERWDVGARFRAEYEEYRQKTRMFGPVRLWVALVGIVLVLMGVPHLLRAG